MLCLWHFDHAAFIFITHFIHRYANRSTYANIQGRVYFVCLVNKLELLNDVCRIRVLSKCNVADRLRDNDGIRVCTNVSNTQCLYSIVPIKPPNRGEGGHRGGGGAVANPPPAIEMQNLSRSKWRKSQI